MSEEDVREGLRAAVSEEPPLNFDPNVLVITARQRATRRRALVAVGTATVAIAVAAVAIPASFEGGTTPAATQPTSNKSTPPTSTQTPAATVEYTADQLRTRGEEMRTHLRDIVPVVLPAASAVEYGEFGGEAAGEFFDGQHYVNAPVTFTVDGARYSIFVAAYTSGETAPSESSVCAAQCQTLDTRDDGMVVANTEDLGQQKITKVHHFRKNGSVVQVSAYNYDMTGVPAYQPTIPVTLEQLSTLATDPELGL